MKYYLVAGEASGDLHGANLMKALKERDSNAQFRFFGGDLMQAQGGNLVKHYADMAYMGVVEVMMNLRTILKNMAFCKEDILAWQPDVVILIDFPGFNLKIAEFAKEHHFQVDYYISPKVWAWNQKRVLKIKKVIDHLFCILPFEVDFYRAWGMDVNYVGNPLLDAISQFTPDPNFRQNHNWATNKKIVALLPGSRKQEINYLLPEMMQLAERFPQYQFVIAGAPSFNKAYYLKYLDGKEIPVIFDATYDLLHIADAAIVASGTATLETALFHVPQAVVYKAHPIFIGLGRLVVKIKYISLVNLIMDAPVVRELIQGECNPEVISEELTRLLEGNYREKMLDDYNELDIRMGKPGASAKTADLIIKYLNK